MKIRWKFSCILSHPSCLICLLALSNAHAATHKANCILLNLYMSMCVCASVAFNSMYLIRYVSFVIMHAIASVAYKLLFRVRMWVPFTDVHRQTKRFLKKRIWAIKSTIKTMPKPLSKIKRASVERRNEEILNSFRLLHKFSFSIFLSFSHPLSV